MPENRTPYNYSSYTVRVIEYSSATPNDLCRHDIVGSCPYCRESSEDD